MNNQKCEFQNCRKNGSYADTYMNMWFCLDHYSLIGKITEDYQKENIDLDELENWIMGFSNYKLSG